MSPLAAPLGLDFDQCQCGYDMFYKIRGQNIIMCVRCYRSINFGPRPPEHGTEVRPSRYASGRISQSEAQNRVQIKRELRRCGVEGWSQDDETSHLKALLRRNMEQHGA